MTLRVWYLDAQNTVCMEVIDATHTDFRGHVLAFATKGLFTSLQNDWIPPGRILRVSERLPE